MNPTDKNGKEIKLLSRIAYATRQWDNAKLVEGKVIAIEWTGEYNGKNYFRLKLIVDEYKNPVCIWRTNKVLVLDA